MLSQEIITKYFTSIGIYYLMGSLFLIGILIFTLVKDKKNIIFIALLNVCIFYTAIMGVCNIVKCKDYKVASVI